MVTVEMTMQRHFLERYFRETREQNRQGEKMQAIGRFAGGIAYDFNKFLTFVYSQSETILKKAKLDEYARQSIEGIRDATGRATSLVRLLVTLSGSQTADLKVINLNKLIAELRPALQRFLTEDIQLITDLNPDLWLLRSDAGLIETIIWNLASNGRDATLPQAGDIVIKTQNLELTNATVDGHPEIGPGRYVVLTVSDNGSGMTESVKRHLFEPFFTTKPVGSGAGLGLATVYNIVKQCRGHIVVSTEFGRGSKFTMYFPATEGVVDTTPSIYINKARFRGAETILLVEDEDDLRAITSSSLQIWGYTVLEARNSEEALEICRQYSDSIDLLVTDLIMPGMTGDHLAVEVSRLRPGIPVLLISGYPDATRPNVGTGTGPHVLLSKPYEPEVLVQTARQLLDSRGT
jgi:nitrogen-specific signal transduction histidine kinase